MVDGFRAEVQSQLNDLAELMHEFPACRDALGADGGPDVVQAFRDFVAERSAVVGAQMERIAALEAENAELLESLFWYFGQSRYSVRPARGGYYLFDNQASRYPVRIDPDSSGSTWMRWQDAIDAAREGKS